MLAKEFDKTPDWILWNVRLDRGLISQQALLRARNEWTVPPKLPEPPVSVEDVDAELEAALRASAES